jgi:hypothetical protein
VAEEEPPSPSVTCDVKSRRLSAWSQLFGRVAFGAAVVCGVANLISACSAKAGNDGFDSVADAGPESGASTRPSTPADSGSDAGLALLETSPNCPLSLFEPGTSPEDFSSDASIAGHWIPNYAAPEPSAGGSLQFGPHPMSDNWWENYSPITSVAKPGDVLICARLRLSPDADADAGADDSGSDSTGASSNTFELTMRLPDDAGFETAGMALEIAANASQIALHTRTGSDTWITHDTAPFTLSSSAISTVDVVLFAQGSSFVAQARNVDSGEVAHLHADYNLPAGGAVSLLGWRERAPTFVDRLVMGVPTASTLPALQ